MGGFGVRGCLIVLHLTHVRGKIEEGRGNTGAKTCLTWRKEFVSLTASGYKQRELKPGSIPSVLLPSPDLPSLSRPSIRL